MSADHKMTGYKFDGLSKVIARCESAESRRPPAVIASVFQTGLNLMRDLQQKGVRAVGVDCDLQNPGFRSKYGLSFLCPNPDKEPENWVAFMVALATLTTKEKQYALAREYGLPSPASAYIQSEDELKEFCDRARFPVLLKPRSHREWQGLPKSNPLWGCKTVSSRTPKELLATYRKVSTLVSQAVAQEEIVGPDSAKYCYLSVYSRAGHRLGACVVQELRAYPLLYGCATLVEPTVDEEIDRICNNFLLSLGFVGICEIEVKKDLRDDKPLLIEVNPRFSGTGDCAKYTGVEVGHIHYLDLIGQTPSPVVATKFGFRHMMLVNDITAFPIYLDQGLITWRKWLKSLRGQLEFLDFDLKDFSNARSAAVRAAQALIGGLLRTWRLRK
jgi:D-aspartate ligase